MVSTFQYDGKDRLTAANIYGAAVTSTANYSYTYDGNDNMLFNGEANSATFTYDAANRQVTGIDVSGNLYTNTFDNNGNLVGASNSSYLVTTAFDKVNRLVQHLQSDGTASTYSYNSFGKKRTEDLNSSVTTLVWDGEDYLQGRN